MDPFITGPILLAIIGRELIAWIVRRNLAKHAPKLEDWLEKAWNRPLTDVEKQAIARQRAERVIDPTGRFFD